MYYGIKDFTENKIINILTIDNIKDFLSRQLDTKVIIR